MPEYGITNTGFNIKRMDAIVSDIHADLKDAWGVDTSMNEQSFLGAMIRTFSARIAELWEMAQGVYYSQYPATAEGVNLDNAMQFGGVVRLENRRTIYPIACTGDDGTDILYGTLIRSVTTPAKDFQCLLLQKISRENFRKLILSVNAGSDSAEYSIEIEGNAYSYVRKDGDKVHDILKGLKEAVICKEVVLSLVNNEEDKTDENLVIEAVLPQSSYRAVLTDNIIVKKATSNILFESLEYGNISVPTNTITTIVTNVMGLDSVTNDITPTAGRIEESDIAARQSYIKRIAIRSKNIVDGIVADLYQNVDGVLSAIGMENYTDYTDADGRPPHSIEIIVDGGDESEIAQVIFDRRCPGIRAYGTTSIDISDPYGNVVAIGFSRPDYRYVWLRITMQRNTKETIAPNYVLLAKNAVMENCNDYGLGEKVILQKFLPHLYRAVTGVQYIEIKAAVTSADTERPGAYNMDVIAMLSRQKAQFDAMRIEVLLDDN